MSDTKQINVRIPVGLHSSLAAHKDRTGEDKSDVVRRGIELALNIEPQQERTPGENPPQPGPAESTAAAAESAGDHPVDPVDGERGGSGDSTSDSSTSSEEPKSEHVDFPQWLADRTDQPRALCRLRVVAGHVEINGERYQEETIPALILETAAVTLGGQPV